MQERVENGERTYSEPSRKLHNKYLITTHTENEHKVWTIAPKQNTSNKQIIYFHGGAYVNSFSPQHWTFMSRLVDSLNLTVTAPNYPHAPEYCATDTNEMVFDVFKKLSNGVGAANITLMGDSSGGGISLALAQRIRDERLEQPGHIILLSPWLDVTLSNPEIVELDRIDPFLGVTGLKWSGKAYSRGLDPLSPAASPLYGSLKGLGPISVYIGTRDIFLADCRKLKDKAIAEGASVNYREYKGMVHNWMLGPMPEAKQVLKEIVDTLKNR
jgi:acetyl esterase/lipase